MAALLDPPTNLDVLITTRVTVEQKRAMQAIARARQLAAADILREALREYLARRSGGAGFFPESGGAL